MSWGRSAGLGAIAWLAIAQLLGVARWPERATGALLLLGVLVAVPLALGLVAPRRRPELGRWRVARRAQPLAAGAVLVSFALPPGASAGWLAVPWLAFTAWTALLGSLRSIERGGGPAGEIAQDAGLALLVVGGVWLCASRFGAPLLGFREPWVALTAAHFHFAGLVLPVVAGCIAQRSGAMAAAGAAGVAAGVPIVAVGITAGSLGHPQVEWACASYLVLACMPVAWSALRLGLRQRRPAGDVLAAAGVALAVAMVLAGLWATASGLGGSWLDVDTMVLTHAALNVFGFALPALLALQRIAPAPEVPGMEVLLLPIGDRPAVDWEARRCCPDPLDRAALEHDRYDVELGVEDSGPPLPGGVYAEAAARIECYDVFPPDLLRPLVVRAPVLAGDTVRARYRLLPGLELVFGARVTGTFDEVREGVQRAGFTYRTLAGHPLQGEETFAVEKELASGRVTARIAAASEPATALSRLLRPLVRMLQHRAGRAALQQLRERARGE